MRRLAAALCLLAGLGSILPATANDRAPVGVVADGRLAVGGDATLAVGLSSDWSRPLHAVAQVVVMLHGADRDAEAARRIADAARETAGALAQTVLVVAPQFLADVDAQAHQLPSTVLRWTPEGWNQGDPALGPAPVSSFAAIDALLARLADPTGFPALRQVVLAGHSAGAQAVQRYAAVGRGEAALSARGIAVRYVVANPSSWLWFDADRPRPVADCPGVDAWKYGLRNTPAYVADPAGAERVYLARDVVYLLGEADTDPAHPALDRSCAAMAQGDTRLARGMLFMFHLELRHPNLVHHRVVGLPGIGHDARRMFTSVCGLGAVFGRPGCPGLR